MTEEKNITARSITLFKEKGGWLGQIVLTSDGMFAAITDYGNFSFAWRSIGDDKFEDFLINVNTDYFGGKMYQGMTYIAYGKKIEQAAHAFAQHVLPALQKFLKAEKEPTEPLIKN